jgi:hypothetical protein
MSLLTEKTHRLKSVAVGAFVILGVFFVITGEWLGSIAGGLLVAVSIVAHFLTTDNELGADTSSPNQLLALAALCTVAFLLAETLWHVWGEDHKALLSRQVLIAVERICVGIAVCGSVLSMLEALIGTTVERRS